MSRKSKERRSQGSGSIYFSDFDQRWIAQLYIGVSRGRKKFRRARCKTEKEAVAMLQKFQIDAHLGVPQDTTKQTLAEYLNHWLEHSIKPNREPKTYSYYEQMVRLYVVPETGAMRLTKFNVQHGQALITAVLARGLSPRTTQAVLQTLKCALNTAWRQSLIRENPMRKVTPPKMVQKEAVYLQSEDAAKLIVVARNHPLGGVVEFAMMTGLRIGEITGLVWDDVDFDKSLIRVRQQLQRVNGVLIRKELKSRSAKRVLPISEDDLQLLLRQKALQATQAPNAMNLVFTAITGAGMDPKNANSLLGRLCKAAGIPVVSFHKLRHTAATHMAANGVPLTVVKDHLGHSQISLTANTYSHAMLSSSREAASVLNTALRAGIARKQDDDILHESPSTR